MISNPWKNLVEPNNPGAMNAIRIDAEHPWNFFWARGYDHRYMLALAHSPDSSPRSNLPRMKGIELELVDDNQGKDRVLVFKLLDAGYKDIFYRLCSDIVASTENAKSEKEAVDITLARTWRWHHLLRGGSDGRLSIEEQKGLIGELFVLEKYLLSALPAIDAVNAWQGPSGASRDFEIERLCIEAKARRSGLTTHIAINSEYQLDDNGLDSLFLYVVALDQADDDDDGFSLTDVVSSVKESIGSVNTDVTGAFESKLMAAGFNWQDDYSGSLFLEKQSQLYRVREGFPRITFQSITVGVSNVRYHISLDNCAPFIVSDDMLTALLER